MWARGMRELTGLAVALSIPQNQSECGSVRKIIHIFFLCNVNTPCMDFLLQLLYNPFDRRLMFVTPVVSMKIPAAAQLFVDAMLCLFRKKEIS